MKYLILLLLLTGCHPDYTEDLLKYEEAQRAVFEKSAAHNLIEIQWGETLESLTMKIARKIAELETRIQELESNCLANTPFEGRITN